MIYKLLGSSTIQGVGAITILLSDFILAKSLPTEEYGLIVSILNWFTLLTILSVMGVNQIYLKLIPQFNNNQESQKIEQLLVFGTTIVLLFCILAIVVTFILSSTMPAANFWTLFLIALVGLPFSGFNQLLNYFLRSSSLISQGLTNEFLVRPVSFILLVIMMHSWVRVDVKLILLAFILSHIIATISGSYLTCKRINFQNVSIKFPEESKNWFRLALPVFFIQLFGYLSIKLDLIILSLFNSNTELAIYNISAKMAEPIVFVLVAMNAFVLPTVSLEYAKKNHELVIQTLTKASKMSFYLAMPILILVVFNADFILSVFGDAYKAGKSSLIILAVGQFASIVAGPVSTLLMLLNKGHVAAKATFYSFVINALLCMLLVPNYGIVGAALASATSMITLNTYLYLYLKKNLKQHFSYVVATLFKFSLQRER